MGTLFLFVTTPYPDVSRSLKFNILVVMYSSIVRKEVGISHTESFGEPLLESTYIQICQETDVELMMSTSYLNRVVSSNECQGKSRLLVVPDITLAWLTAVCF